MLPIHCRLVNTQSSFDCSAVHYVYVNILHFGFVDDVILVVRATGIAPMLKVTAPGTKWMSVTCLHLV